jgi:hypothetical protein
MIDLSKLKVQLEDLFRQHCGSIPEEIYPLPESGSGRHYFRLQRGKTSLIAVWNEQTAENQAFVYLSEMLSQIGFPVPKVVIYKKIWEIPVFFYWYNNPFHRERFTLRCSIFTWMR